MHTKILWAGVWLKSLRGDFWDHGTRRKIFCCSLLFCDFFFIQKKRRGCACMYVRLCGFHVCVYVSTFFYKNFDDPIAILFYEGIEILLVPRRHFFRFLANVSRCLVITSFKVLKLLVDLQRQQQAFLGLNFQNVFFLKTFKNFFESPTLLSPTLFPIFNFFQIFKH